MTDGGRPDVAAVMEGLKPFQRDTVEHVFRQLYLEQDGSNRFLVSDEVGLGKTLVARGVIAKTMTDSPAMRELSARAKWRFLNERHERCVNADNPLYFP